MLTPEIRNLLIDAYAALVTHLLESGVSDIRSLADTPRRITNALEEMFSGIQCDPRKILEVNFPEADYDQMIIVADMSFVSMCEHHFLPFHGKVHFGYLPKSQVVGLSKIPRLVDVYARRPQIQERLTRNIVDTFQEVVQPLGCGAVVEAWHSCVGVRGVRKPETVMRTVALAGNFREPDVKAEFLDSVNHNRGR